MSLSLSTTIQEQIIQQIDIIINRYLERARNSPSSNSGNPFVLALLRDFEPLIHRLHGMKTSLGSQMEKIAEIIANEKWGRENVHRNVKVKVNLPKNVFATIDSIINELSNAQNLSDYMREKQQVIDACNNPGDDFEEHIYDFDLVINDVSNRHIYVLEMKGPDPNTTEVPGAKKRLLSALAWKYLLHEGTKDIDVQLGIYYNNKYPRPYKNPKVFTYFNPNKGLLVHDNFWNLLGKNLSTFNELVLLFEDYGRNNKERIWNTFSHLIQS
jgi:hypothetical protein